MWDYRLMRMEHVFIWTGVFLLVFVAVAVLCAVAYLKLKDWMNAGRQIEKAKEQEEPSKNRNTDRAAIIYGVFVVVAVCVIALLFRAAIAD